MISIRPLLAAAILAVSCNIATDEDPGYGYRLSFRPESCEQLTVSEYRQCLLVELDGAALPEHSAGIEDQIRRYYTLFLRRNEGGGNVITVDYRMEKCLDIRITSPVTLFGETPGSDISGHFTFLSSEDWTDFIITDDDRLIGTIPTGMTIREYLSKSPLVFPKALLSVDSTPDGAPSETTLSITVTLEDRVLSAEVPFTFER